MGSDRLNEQQKLAAKAPGQPVLIVAGPGTGKTKTLVARIAHLIGQGVPAERIVALTFTNKAAREMRERVAAVTAQMPTVTTFHALAHELLTQTGHELKLIPEPERQSLLLRLKKSQALKGLSTRELSLKLSLAKNTGESDDALAPCLRAYNLELAARGLHDFDDLLLKLRDQLKHDNAFRQHLQQRYQTILVDEFQDTNALQYELLGLMNATDNVFVIGDPRQSIYGFRGASAGIFERFLDDRPQALQVQLGTNYRSAAELVCLGCAVFPEAPRLRAHRTTPGQVRAVQVLNEYTEADWIISSIEQAIGGSTMLKSSEHHAGQGGGQSFSDFAVIYRTHALAKPVRCLLEASGIPFQVAGEGSPYEQPDIRAILNVLAYCGGKGELAAYKKLTPRQLEALIKPLKATNPKLSQLAAAVAEKLGLEITGELRQFLNGLTRFDDAGAAVYLDHIQTIAEQAYYDPAADAVTLLTIHAAKGLEFKQVFLIGADEGSLPHIRAGREPDIEEERRLFYVAVTRARDHLDILQAKKRGGQPVNASRFTTSLPAHVLPEYTDPAMSEQIRSAQKRALKPSQTSLF